MVGSVGTSQNPANIQNSERIRPEISSHKQPDLMPMRRPGEETLRPEAAEESSKKVKKDPEFLLHHTRATLEERMKQVLSEQDIKMLLYLTAPLPRTENTMAEPGQLFDVLG